MNAFEAVPKLQVNSSKHAPLPLAFISFIFSLLTDLQRERYRTTHGPNKRLLGRFEQRLGETSRFGNFSFPNRSFFGELNN
jgi:hypothetical protein